MTDEARDLAGSVDFDLDEDLFGFGESSLSELFDPEEDADLDEIFAAFQEAHEDGLLDDPVAADEGIAQAEPAGYEEVRADEPVPVRQAGARRTAEKRPKPPAPVLDDDVWTPQNVVRPEPVRGAHAAPPVVVSGGLSRSVVWLLVAVTSVNALVAAVTLRGTSAMRDSVAEVGRHVAATADEIRTGAYEQARVLNDLETPVVPTDPEQHPTFDRARAEIAKGQYTQARQRLYALLSIVDRIDPAERQKVEARAQYLLAEALHLEALERLEVRQ